MNISHSKAVESRKAKTVSQRFATDSPQMAFCVISQCTVQRSDEISTDVPQVTSDLSGAKRGSRLGWSLGHCLPVLTAPVVLALFGLGMVCSCEQNIFLAHSYSAEKKSNRGQKSGFVT